MLSDFNSNVAESCLPLWVKTVCHCVSGSHCFDWTLLRQHTPLTARPLKIKEIQASETSVASHPMTQRHIPEERISLSYLVWLIGSEVQSNCGVNEGGRPNLHYVNYANYVVEI